MRGERQRACTDGGELLPGAVAERERAGRRAGVLRSRPDRLQDASCGGGVRHRSRQDAAAQAAIFGAWRRAQRKCGRRAYPRVLVPRSVRAPLSRAVPALVHGDRVAKGGNVQASGLDVTLDTVDASSARSDVEDAQPHSV